MGVPQGTILGPLFFILYINDLLELLLDCLAYADDTLVLASADTWHEAEQTMNLHLNKINNWLALNQLSLNLTKSVYIAFWMLQG